MRRHYETLAAVVWEGLKYSFGISLAILFYYCKLFPCNELIISISEMLTMLQVKDYLSFYPSSTQKREGKLNALLRFWWNSIQHKNRQWRIMEDRGRSLKWYYTMSNYCCFFNVLTHQIFHCRKEQRKHDAITAETMAFLCETQIALWKPHIDTQQRSKA